MSLTQDQVAAAARFFARLHPMDRFVADTATMRPVPPLGFHFPWDGKPGTCAMCGKTAEQLADAAPCEFDWPPAVDAFPEAC